ncbi:MAG: bifunctional diguanylate cyclase/phosphodiesterase [Pseudomonadota bacterium]
MPNSYIPATSQDEMAQRIAELEYRLATDGLTGARSRDYFLEHYSRYAERSGTLYFVDLDNFKSVNDHYGHMTGDRLLKLIVDKMVCAIGTDTFVARLGGDEFVVLSPFSHLSAIEALGDALLDACQAAHIIRGELQISRGASIGCVRLSPQIETHEAIDMGDTAMRCAKALGKNRVHLLNVHEDGLTSSTPSVDELRLGLERSEIGYYLQPIVCCRRKEVAGFEALLRWERHNGQILAPAQFLTTMTEAYAVNARPPLEFAREATEWVTRQNDAYCFFNISMAFLERIAVGSDAWVDDIIGRSPRNRIVFEITEAAIRSEVEAVVRTVQNLRDSGIQIALDDFGVGASNLERLDAMPVDLVKVDRRFVRGADQDQKTRDILKGMIDIGQRAGAKIVVEGIEEEAQFELVRELGAEFAQGFLIGHPKPYQRHT